MPGPFSARGRVKYPAIALELLRLRKSTNCPCFARLKSAPFAHARSAARLPHLVQWRGAGPVVPRMVDRKADSAAGQ